MDNPTFVIEPQEAESSASHLGVTVLNLLSSLVKPAQSYARPPISKFHVGAVGLGSSGRIFLGVNVEFPNLPLHHSIHAEQFLVTNLNLNGETKLISLAVSAAPCGHCRQFLQEIRNASDIKILITDQTSDSDGFLRLGTILPHRFGPEDLLHKDHPLLLEAHNNNLDLISKGISNSNSVRDQISNGNSNSVRDSNSNRISNSNSVNENSNSVRDSISNGISNLINDLKFTALDAANRSYAPYSKCPSGVALLDCEGRVYRGWYMESAAYNPSLGPVQAAIVDYVANGGGGGYERIVGAVLVEKEGAVVRQEHTARLLLQTISPKCEFHVFHCQ